MARALLREPPVLVLDELATRLPAQGYAQLLEWLERYPGVVIYSGQLPGIEPTSSWRAGGWPAARQP
ncbi:hypothetical protein AAHB37_02730 [Glutamicibacter halophytocola]|uniref:hypothetical protein n=1 Tax=Glutamicibacter halophytocola TaxID=1933880 RepID=UPI000F9C4D3D